MGVVELNAPLIPRCSLVTGPASSGKSLWAETLAQRSKRPVLYLATGPELPDDEAWQERLRRHRERRPNHWHCQEVGLQLTPALLAAPPETCVLVDSLGTWVAAALDLDATSWAQLCAAMADAVRKAPAPLVLVGEEAAWGVVPATAAGGVFRQRLGNLLQQLMPLCDDAWLVLHGRALNLMQISDPINPGLSC